MVEGSDGVFVRRASDDDLLVKRSIVALPELLVGLPNALSVDDADLALKF